MKDIVSNERVRNVRGCSEPGWSISQGEGQVEFRVNGKVTLAMKNKLLVSREGCVYEFSQVVGYNEISSEAGVVTTQSVGKVREGSASSCARTLTLTFSYFSHVFQPSYESIEMELYVPQHK